MVTKIEPGPTEKLTSTPLQPRMSMYLDVATRYTGYAVFERGTITPPSHTLILYGIFKSGANKDWEVRCLSMFSKINNIIGTIKPGMLVLEFPSYQAGSKGIYAARKGYTLELAYLCGKIAMGWEYYITKVMVDTGLQFPLSYNVEYRSWNGQLQKKHTCKRLFDHFAISADPQSLDNNFADAIMMGKWHIEDKIQEVVTKGSSSAERVDY